MPYKNEKDRKESQKKYDAKRRDWTARCWQCVVYPESADEDWKKKVHSIGLAYTISPLHDQDVTSDGEVKKPHHHVIFDWGAASKASGNKAIEIFEFIKGVFPPPDKDRKLFLAKCKVRNYINAHRYLCHLDEHDPAKHKYDIADIVEGYQEYPYADRILKAMEKDELALQMVDFCMAENIYTFDVFVLSAKEAHPEWMHAIINERPGTFVNRFLAGRIAANHELRAETKDQRELEQFKAWERKNEERHS